jgi:hypothetical protein
MIIKNKNIVARQVHDTYFLIDITEDYLNDKCSLYETNEMGYFIWKQLDVSNNSTDITKAILSVIQDDVDYSMIYNDVDGFIHLLIGEQFLEEVNGQN